MSAEKRLLTAIRQKACHARFKWGRCVTGQKDGKILKATGRVSGVENRRLAGSFIILEKKRTAAGLPLVPPGPGDRP